MILIGLGANLPSFVGTPQATLRASLDALGMRGAQAGPVSHFYRTPAWPDPADPPFVNAAARLTTKLDPRALLDLLKEIETMFGCEREEKNAPRTLDLDLLDFDGRVEQGPPQLPHPMLATRAFVLVPLRDIAPLWRHPVSGKGVAELIAELGPDGALAKRIN